MGELNPSAATTTDFKANIPDYIVTAKSLDTVNDKAETYVYFENAQKHYGYYLTIPEIFNAANALATWSVSRGWTSEDIDTQVQLEQVRGQGNSSFLKIMWNHVVVKLVVGDAFCEVKRSESGRILNMIPISPERVKIVYNSSGMIKRYEVWNGSKWQTVPRENMLHSSNKKIGDQTHGTSQIEPSEFIIKAIQEALEDERVIKHRDKALGIVRYKTDKAGKINHVNSQIETAIKNGDMVGLPGDVAEIEPWPSKSSEDRTGWIQYLENRFYQNFGVPRSIASSDGTSEVGGKMGHVIFEPIYTKEQVDLEEDLETQQAIIIKFNRPPSLGGMQPELDESKNTGQVGIQPNDVSATMERE